MKPPAVARVEALVGGDASSWKLVTTRGYAVGERWIVRLTDGRSAFVKIGVEDWMVDNMRAEMRVYGHVDAPFLPRLLAWDPDGEPPVLVLEDLSGADWPPPWSAPHLDAVLATMDDVAATPPPPGLERFEDELEAEWAKIDRDPEPFLSLGLVTRGWLADAMPALREAEHATPFAGTQLLHCDLRSDNLCIKDGRAILFDWNWALIGNPALDIAFWLPSLALEGGPPVDEMAARRPETNPFAAYVAAFFGSRAGLPAPPGAPAVRAFQLAQLEVALPWAARILSLPPLDGQFAAR